MIRLFGVNDTTFSSNGDLVLEPLEAIVHKEDNGPFYLSLVCGLEYVDDLTEGRIVVCSTPQGDQPFRIHNVTATRKKVSCQCRHIFYDTENYLIADSYVVDKDADDALDHLISATEPTSPFSAVSDVGVQNSYRCVRKSLYEAVQEVIARWGGHLTRDGWQIGLYESIGADNGVTVEYAKNLRDITVSYDWTNVVTKLMPEGFDGLMLPEVYLVSETQYEVPYTKCVVFNQSVDREAYMDEDGNLDEEAYEAAMIDDLRQQATLYLAENCVPKVNYTLAADLDRITDIGDTVQVNDQRLGISLLTNVISYDYNPILGKYIQVEFGNFRKSLTGLMSTINSNTETIVERTTEEAKIILGQELTEATARIWNAMSNSYVIYEGNQILIVDSLPKESATYAIRINAGGIGFSSSGIAPEAFNSCWEINGTMNMQNFNVINLTANLIKGGTLKLGNEDWGDGSLELYNQNGDLIGTMDKTGFKMYGPDGSYVVMNATDGFAGYVRSSPADTKVFWADQEEFHMRKSEVEEEITFCGKMRIIPITIDDGNGNIISDGIGWVSVNG